MSKRRAVPETVDSLVGVAMSGIAGEAAEEAAARQRDTERLEVRARRMRVAAGVLVPACAVLTMLNVAGFLWFAPDGPLELSPAEVRTAAMLLLSDAADELDSSMRQNGRYPLEPAFIGPDGPTGDDEPFAYQLVGTDRYVLSVTVADETFTFDSREGPDDVFHEVRDVR